MSQKSGENKITKLISRYENMLNNNTLSFFDSHEFEDIADHYIERGLLGEAMGSMEMAFKQYPFSANFLIKKAQILTILRKITRSRKNSRYSETLEPSNPDLHIAKGSILSKKENIRRLSNISIRLKNYQKTLLMSIHL